MSTEPSDGMPHTGEVVPTQQAQPGIVLFGGAGWNSMPVATAPRLGLWNVYNVTAGQFPGWATTSGVKVVTGKFGHQGLTDTSPAGPLPPTSAPSPSRGQPLSDQPICKG